MGKYIEAKIPNSDEHSSYLEEDKLWNVTFIFIKSKDDSQFAGSLFVTAPSIEKAKSIVAHECEKKMSEVVFEDPKNNIVIYAWDYYQIIGINLIHKTDG